MNYDMITIFNQLTSSELADCNLFESLLDGHFLKFRYFYALISGINLSKVNDISCKTMSDNISICIAPHENKYINDIIKLINKNKKNSLQSDNFDTNVIESNSVLYVDIYMSDSSKEGDSCNAD